MVKKSLLVLLLLLGAFAVAAEPISIAQLAKDKVKLDGKKITITGIVEKFQQKVSKKGNEYFVGILVDKEDKKKTVNLFGQGKLEKELKKGDIVEVEGEYRQEKKLDTMIFKNEIESTPDQVKVLPKK